MVFDFRDGWKGDLHKVAVRAFDLYAWRRQGLGRFHAAHRSSYSPAIERNDLDIVLAVERLECRQCFRNFHVHPPLLRMELSQNW